MTQRLPPGLALGLVATLLASAWAVWWPQDAKQAPLASPRVVSTVDGGATALASVGAPGADEHPALSPPSRDPFNAMPPPPAANKPEPEPARHQAAAPPPPPAPPRMEHRVVGRFKSPDGQELVFLQDGAQTAVATAGITLSSGYVVESITPREIRLRHPLAEQSVSLLLPEINAP